MTLSSPASTCVFCDDQPYHLLFRPVCCQTCFISPVHHPSLVRQNQHIVQLDRSIARFLLHATIPQSKPKPKSNCNLNHAWFQVCRDPRHHCHTILTGQCRSASNNRRITSPLSFVWQWQHFQLERKRTIAIFTNFTGNDNSRTHQNALKSFLDSPT
jgi:hypothetical protein